MENIIEVSNADQAPQENAGLSVNNPTVPNGEIPVNTGVSETITEETQEVSPRDDSTRFEYWQSQADKAKGELNALRQELEYYRSNTNPAEQSSVSNGQPQAYPEQGLQEPSLKEPTAPERPHSYNEVDAYNDPQSESFKYRVAKESYRDKYLDFLTKTLHDEYLNILEKEITKAFVSAYDEQAEALFNNYLDHAEAYVNMTTVKDSVTNEEINPDESFMASIEEQIGITGTSRENFRVDITAFMFSKLRRSEKVDWQSYAPLKEAIESKLTSSVKQISRIVTKSKSRDKKQQGKYNEMVQTLIKEYGYNENSAEEVIKFASNNL